MDKDTVLVYTDGSCMQNPGGEGSYAIVIIDDMCPIKLSGYYKETTNQRMELTAVIEAMRFFKDKRSIHIHSDSAYVCNCFNSKWYESWIKNDFMNSKNEPVANKELWLQFIELIKFHDVKITKVKGHSDNILNNECDQMCREIILFKRALKADK